MSSDGSSVVLFQALPASLKLSSTEKRLLQEFARSLSAHVSGDRPFTCLVTNDRELSRLNREFLGRDYPADVLSFPVLRPIIPEPNRQRQPGAASKGHAQMQLGEIAISIERAAAQAAEHGHELLGELRILMLHGLLHLTGFDHERDHGEMARAERKWRNVFALPTTLIARAEVPPGVQE
jgi:probable rRNA maturation factor